MGEIKNRFEVWKKSDGLFWTVIIIIIVLILTAGYFLFSYVKTCNTKECFEKAIVNCKRASWIREDDQASWSYIILNSRGKSYCNVQIKLLKLNKGTIDSENLQGKEMTCELVKGNTDFPEKDISRCHGLLKEEMQDVLIQRMHNYLLQNVGDIQKSFQGFE